MNKDTYCYPATIEKEKNGYKISFIDFDCEVYGEEILTAIEEARETIALKIDKMEEVKDPTDISKLKSNKVIVMIDFNVNVYKFKENTKAITRAVTLPKNLNEVAKASNINVSALLQEALKGKLGIEE